MNHFGSFALILLAALALSFGESGSAQSLRLRTQPPPVVKADEEPSWQGDIRYGVASDYADTRTPRGYTNVLAGSLGRKFNDTWSVSTEIGMRAEFINGQIEKGQEQSYSEVVSPTTSLELDYDGKFSHSARYSAFLHGEPLWDEASRLEGYKGLVGAGGEINLEYFHKIWTIGNSLDVTELINTYKFGSDLSANPDYFLTYRLTNSIRFWNTYKLGYIFGLKTTRYLDGFWGYNYENSIRLSKKFGGLTVAISYENGGFTDDGTMSLWYVDRFRRIGRLSMIYSF